MLIRSFKFFPLLIYLFALNVPLFQNLPEPIILKSNTALLKFDKAEVAVDIFHDWLESTYPSISMLLPTIQNGLSSTATCGFGLPRWPAQVVVVTRRVDVRMRGDRVLGQWVGWQ
jgi:hypothetical protein